MIFCNGHYMSLCFVALCHYVFFALRHFILWKVTKIAFFLRLLTLYIIAYCNKSCYRAKNSLLGCKFGDPARA